MSLGRENPQPDQPGACGSRGLVGSCWWRGEVGHLTEQVVGLAGSQVLALDCWAHMHRAGTSNALTAWLAQRPQPAHGGEGAPGGRVAGNQSPEAGFPRV